jgi:hypothetical protein
MHRMVVYHADTVHELQHRITENLNLVLETPGVLLVLYSLILTRGTRLVREEFTKYTGLTSLIGEDACCEQVH